MNIICLQHVPFEGPAYYADWAKEQGHTLSCRHLYRGDKIPDADEADFFLIMGGPMSVHDTEEYPWLLGEMELIRRAADSGKRILGICLGAQLIAKALGGDVVPGKEKEIGWFPLQEGQEIPRDFTGLIPGDQKVFHWHGEQCIAPPGSVPLWESPVCSVQGFLAGSQVLGLQFHLETTEHSAALLIENCREELADAPHIQREEEMLVNPDHFTQLNKILKNLMASWLLLL